MKQKMFFCVIALMFCMLTSNAFALNFSQQQAYLNTRALYMNPSNVDFYVTSVTDFINEDGICNIDSATLASHPALASAASKWLVFVDEEPLKAWPHNCSYYYYTKTYFPIGLNFDVDQIKVIGQMPPNIKMTPKSVQNRYDESMCGAPSVPNIKLHRKFGTTNPVAANTHVLLINASPTPVSNYQRYWNDLSYLYTVLTRRYGISKDNIDILCSDGTDPDTDMYDGADGLISSSNDFDNDGVDEDVYSAHKQCLQQLMYNYAEDLGEDDNLLIFITGCGAKLNNAPFIWMWNNEKLYSTELATMLNSLDVNTINMVFGFCFSGQFADVLEAPGRVITSACEGHSDLWPLYDRPYTSFTYHWTSALNKLDLAGTIINADQNGDGMISMIEAFNYANENDVEEETSNITSNPLYVKKELSLLHYPPAVDLFMRDTITDVGDEPNMACENVYWDTPDIWTRNNRDSIAEHEQPIIMPQQLNNKDVWVYAKIRNRGWKPYIYGNTRTHYFHGYWIDASLGMNYDTWISLHQGENGIPLSGRTDVMPIVVNILPGDSTIICSRWSINYMLATKVLNSDGGFLHCCFLGNVSKDYNQDDLNDYNKWIEDLVHRLTNVKGSNDLAQKNLTIFHSDDINHGPLYLEVRGVDSIPNTYNIELIPDITTANELFDNTINTVQLSPYLYNNWQSNGSNAQNVSIQGNITDIFYLNNFESKICNIELGPTDIDSISYSYNLIANEYNSEPHRYKFHIIQTESSSGKIVGGEAIEIRTEGRNPINALIRQDIEDGSPVLIADNINEEVDYEWYDSYGRVVGRGKTLTLNHKSKACEYRLRVIAKKDHAVNFATIHLDKTTAIESISPVPFSGQINVKLTENVLANTKIRLSSLDGNIVLDYIFNEGERVITIYTSQLPKGLYVISLIVNDNVIESHQILK